MKQSGKKLARGQMVYAPITTTESRSRSPFSQSKKSLGISTAKPQQQTFNERPLRQSSSSQQATSLSPQSPYTPYDLSLKQSASPFHDFQQQLQLLAKQNAELKAREEIYVSKLLKLQQGLERQHEEFMNLQELYNELLNVYKQKEEEIAQLDLRYHETERSRIDFSSRGKKEQNISVLSIDKMNSIKQSFLEENFKQQIAQLIFQNKRLNETNQKLVAELNYVKSKEKLQDSRHALDQKVYEQLTDWQKQADQEKEEKIKLEYENRFFKMRNEDLEKTIAELEKIVSMKQSEIIKMREEKFAHRRQSSEKILNKSPPKYTMDSARSKGSNQEKEKEKFVKLIENLQKENHRLREENLLLKQKMKANLFQKQATTLKLSESCYSSGSQNYANFQKRLQFSDNEEKTSSNPLRSYQNQNFNSQNINEQYFSFSREREDRQSQDLPSFPMDLEIQGLIKKHEQDKRSNQAQENQGQLVEGSV